MNWYEILVIVLAALFVVGVIGFSVVRRRRGGGGCGGCCEGCGRCGGEEKKQTQKKG